MTRTTFVLVPGAGGGTWFWHLLVPELRRRGHAAVAVDLPTGDDRAGLREYADAVVAAAGDRAPLVLVAQSMAGFSAPLACERLGDRLVLLVLVNAMVPAPGETAGEWWAATGQPEARRALDLAEGRPVDGEFDPLVTFFHDLPGHVAEEALAQGNPQSDTPFGQPFPLPAWPDVPTRVVVGRDDRLFPAAFQRRVARERLGVEADVLPGGHLVALADPDGLADLLVGYLPG
ncbi:MULTISPECIES: alpha/beta hydrolase [unclassified Streptomyces]|uniref:alpha/beta fold hydrolase n=1 Tax=unclassified Streptomyces TaxID=2593676 RepID=UPI000374A13D|nr:alpha/beta hydrolase [Streptomyces sp. BoleA5]MYX33567.1 alpha/beta fold hydrolase [Streptomyces sp. SID8377]